MNSPQSVVINLGNGNLNEGFERVTAQLCTAGHPLPQQFIGSLPAAPELVELYSNWQSVYNFLCARLDIPYRHEDEDDDELEIDEGGITCVSQSSFDELCQNIQEGINAWLNSEGFVNIDRQLRSALNPSEEIQVIIETDDQLLQRLPWHRCDFCRDYPKAEIALSKTEYKRAQLLQPKVKRKKVRILAILGNSQGIDLERESSFFEHLQDSETVFLVKPSRREFNQQLWDEEGWDMLFFAGHSRSEGETGRIYINEDRTNNSLIIEQLEEALKTAIDNGLKLAIFNSCDGLGLASALEKLKIPTVIVMREPVPNFVAQEFFGHFLRAFVEQRLSLYLAVQQARRKLQGLEDLFLCASWLPAIFQNPAVEPPSWLNLGGTPPCPYRGLFTFREEDAHLFFGREQFTSDLMAAVKKKPLVAVVGPSGSGKSSVVFAGLIPQLRQDSDVRWQIVWFRPGDNPFESLAAALAPLWQQIHYKTLPENNIYSRVNENETTLLKEEEVESESSCHLLELEIILRQDVKALYKIIETFVQQNPGTRIMLIADQFEELYTLDQELACQSFLDGLLNAIRLAPAFTLVLTLRADFYASALSYRPFSDALQGAIQNLGPMSDEELRGTINEPAAQMQVSLEKGLTEKLINSVHGQPGHLPLLEFALTQLWSKQHNGLLTHQAYSGIGGVSLALANHAEAVYAQLNQENKQKAQRVFMQLVQPGEGTESTRRLATCDEVNLENWDLVTLLASNRLVVTNRNKYTFKETVEIVHEALIRSWGRLGQWMQVNGEFRRWQEQLRMTIRHWENSDRDEGALLRGKPLADAEYWQNQRREELSLGEQTFIQESLALRDRVILSQKRRQQRTLIGLTVGLITAILLTASTGWQWRQSKIRESEALSKSSEALFATDKKLEALIEAIRAKRSLQMLLGTDSSTQTTVDLVLKQAVYGLVEYNRLSAHADGVTGVSFSPDGKIIASISEDGTIKLWKINGTLRAKLTGHSAGINAVAFSPDGQTIASASDDQTIKLWNINGTLQNMLKGHSAEVTSVAFSPDGQTIASASDDQTIKLWKINGTLQKTIKGHSAEVTSVAFSPDGQTIASASDDQSIKLWNINGTLQKTIKGHSAEVTSVAFSPDSKTIASASDDQTIKLWNINGTLQNMLQGHSAEVTSVAFSPDGQTIASTSADKTIKLWNLDGILTTTLAGHGDIVWQVEFSPDGKTIASASWDATVRLWQYKNPLLTILSGHSAGITGVSFSPNGKTVASASDDQTVKLWDIDGTLLKTLQGHRSRVYSVAFSPDGQTIASASDDQTIKLWNRDGSLLKTLTGHSAAIWNVSYSPDGQTIASASDDQTIKLWNRDGSLLKTLMGHKSSILEVFFSPDGQTLISVSNDKTLRFWNLDGVLLKTIEGHSETILGGDINPNGQIIASGSSDRTIKLWNLDGSLRKTIEESNANVEDLVFSPGGQTIASASTDTTVKLWSLDGRLLKTLKRHGAGVWGIDYSPDGQILASASADNTVILWNLKPLLDLNELEYACSQIQDYLQNNTRVQDSDRTLCD